MNNVKRILGITLLAAPISVMAGNSDSDTIVSIAAGNDSFSTLVTALKAADLVSTLQTDGPFTVFAPTNEAFSKVPEETLNNLLKPENKAQLQAVLTYHVVSGSVNAETAMSLSEATTVQGEKIDIRVNGNKVMINNAEVVATDIQASNGIIHVIDNVILPPSSMSTANADAVNKVIAEQPTAAGNMTTAWDYQLQQLINPAIGGDL